MNEELKKLKQRLDSQESELADFRLWKASLERSSTIPLVIDQSFRERFKLVTVANKVTTSEDQAVNEGGSATFNVLKSPDKFLQLVGENGTTYYLPAFT